MEKQNLKALYESPKLIEHGDVKQITLGSGHGKCDMQAGNFPECQS